MTITDEMVEKAATELLDWDEPKDREFARPIARSILESVAPLIRSAALEEAARVADGTEQVMIDQPVMGLTMAHRPTATDIAARIRALKDKPHE